MPPGRKLAVSQFAALFAVILSLSSVGIVFINYSPAYSNVTDGSAPFLITANNRATAKFHRKLEAPRLRRTTSTSETQESVSLGDFSIVRKGSVEELIDAIREATGLARGRSDSRHLFTEDELKEWDDVHPCRSRLGLKSMYSRRTFATDVDSNVGWDTVLDEYSKLHRTCMRRVGNVKEYFLARNSSIAGCKFSVADFSEDGGLGNKMLAITNTVLYSILTQRVVLVPRETLLPDLMCEPFRGSSWMLQRESNDTFPIPPWDPPNKDMWTFHEQFYEELDTNVKIKSRDGNNSTRTPLSTMYSTSMTKFQYQPESRFFCDTEQESFAGVTWLYFTGCLYTIPRFFSLPSFRPVLEALFPDRFVLTHLLRSIMLPSDLVWERIVRTDAGNMGGADRRVGLQIRYRRRIEEYQMMNGLINERIMKCALENGVLQPAVEYNATADRELELDRFNIHPPVVKLFIASLFTGFSDMLSKTYLARPTPTGEVVGVVQLSHENEQNYGLEVDIQSLVEIMMLSFSDDLFVTPLSTFGGIAQAYGAIVPWIIDFRKGDQFGPCERGQTVDLCYQEADLVYSCPHDPEVNGRVISEVVPDIRNCLAVDSQEGIKSGFQLITSPKNSSTGGPSESSR